MIFLHVKNKILPVLSFFSFAFVFVTSVFIPTNIAFAVNPPTNQTAIGDCIPGSTGCDYIPLTTIPGATQGCAPDANVKGGYKITTDAAGKTTINNCKAASPIKVIKNIYSVAIGIAAVLAVGMIIWAGIEYATVESLFGKSDAKERWQGAVWGLLLLLGSYLILRTINIDLVNINLDLGKPIEGDKVEKDAVQKALDSYHSALTAVQQTRAQLVQAQQEKATKEAQLATLVKDGKSNTPEAQTLRNEITAKGQEIQKLEQENAAGQKTLEGSEKTVATASQSVTASCYITNVSSKITEKCFPTVEACKSAQIADSSLVQSATKTECSTFSPEVSRGKLDFCVPYIQVKVIAEGVNKTRVLRVAGKQCSLTPATCANQRKSLVDYSSTKKPNEDGYVSDVGQCMPFPKSM